MGPRHRRRLTRVVAEACERRRLLASSLSIADQTAGESAGMISFLVTRSGDLASAVNVQYATADGTAVAGQDYLAAAGVVSFAAGQQTATIDVQLINDTLSEGAETFQVHLSAPPGGGSFAATPFPTGPLPHTAALGDVNNDGRPDVVVANQDASSVSVLLNQTSPGATTPSFAAGQDFPVQAAPDWVAIADFNGDGRNDLAVTNGFSATVSVLLNTTTVGSGTVSFAPRLDLPVGALPRAVVAADLNGDARPDLVTAGFNDDALTVYFNSTPAGAAAATFAPRQDVPVGDGPTALAVTDFNGDGRRDLAIAHFNAGTASVLLNATVPGATTPQFAARVDLPVNAGPRGIVAADLNTDGRQDLAVANAGPGESGTTVSTLLNTTSPGAVTASFASKQDKAVGTGPIAVAAGDLNNDGRMDLAVANFASHNVPTLLNLTAPGATVVDYSVLDHPAGGNSPIFVAAGDVNGDGKVDLATANFLSDTASVLVNAPGVQIDDGTAVGTILDDDAVPVVQFQTPVLSPSEAAGTVNVNVTLSFASGSDVSVPYSVGGTAAAPADYTLPAGPLVIPGGATSASIPVTIVNDAMDEPNETVVITLGTPTGATVGVNGTHTLTIIDNDLPPTVLYAAGDSVDEGAGTYASVVSLSTPSAFDVTVPILLGTGGTATAGADYTFIPGSVVIPAGQTNGLRVVLNLIDDTLVEPQETVFLNLGTPTNATLGSTTSLELRIVDNDAGPAVVESDFRFLDAPQRITFRFSRDVSASLSVADLLVKNLNAETHVPAAAIALAYDATTNTATFTFPGLPDGVLPDGNFRARLSRKGVIDGSGNPLQADGVVNFFALNADANRDRIVDIGDFSVVAAYFNRPGDYSAGDFNYSGAVDLSDFSILASRFGRTRPAPVPPAMYSSVRVPNPQDSSGNFRYSTMSGSDLNDSGAVVGNWSFSIGSTSRVDAFSWSPGQTQIATGPAWTYPAAINNAGIAVGQQTNFGSLPRRAYGPGGILGNPDFGFSGDYGARDINELGNVVGADASSGSQKGVRWLGGAGTYEVVLPQGSLNGINNNGEMVGSANLNAVYFPPGSTTPQVIALNGSGGDINDAGKVVGNFSSGGGSGLPFIWTAANGVFELEPLTTSATAGAGDINNAGLIVGSSGSVGAVWYEGLPFRLSDLIAGGPAPTITQVGGINDLGQILVGNGTDVFVLTPIPGSGPAAPPAIGAEATSSSVADSQSGPLPAVPTRSAGRPHDRFSNRLIDAIDALRVPADGVHIAG